MRIAFLSAVMREADGGLMAARLILGRCLLEWQIQLAQGLGATRIICLSQNASDCVVSAQQYAETQGLGFTTITRVSALSGLVKASDEVVVIADGVFCAKAGLPVDMPAKRFVATLPDPAGTDAGFERIDGSTAWAGLLLVPGRAIEQLVQLPDDFDPHSALLRIALQSGVGRVPLNPELLKTGQLMQDVSEEKSNLLMHRLIRGEVKSQGKATGTWLSDLAVKTLASQILSNPRVNPIILALGGVSLVGSIVATRAYDIVAALGIGILSILLLTTYESAAHIRAAAHNLLPPRHLKLTALLPDIALMIIAALSSPIEENWQALIIVGAMILSLRLVHRSGGNRLSYLAGDRLLLWGALFVASIFGLLDVAASAILIATMLITLFAARHIKRQSG